MGTVSRRLFMGHRSPGLIALLFSTAALSQTASNSSRDTNAQTSSGTPSQTISEIVVTAQKREQLALDVPISLIVLDAKALQQLEITNPEDLQFVVPGLTIQSGGPQRRIDLRGVSNVYGNGAVIGEYMDEADLTSGAQAAAGGYGQPDTRMYDMNRVETLRGPQGTLFGVGAMGGVIRFITNKPDLNSYQMSVDAATLFTQDGAPGQRIDWMVNAPLVSDTLGLRIAGEFDHEGGWVDQPAANLKNINDQNIVDVRFQGLWQPNSQFKVYAMQTIHRNSYGVGQGEDASGNFTQAFGLTTTPTGQENQNLSNLVLTYDFDGIQLLSSSTYWNHSQTLYNNGYTLYDIGGLEEYITNLPFDEENFSEELRVSRTGEGPWQWTFGGLYKHFKDDFNENYYFGVPGPPGSPLDGAGPNTFFENDLSNSRSVFGDTSYQFLERFTLGAGARYFTDHQESVSTGSPLQTATFTSTDPRVYLQFKVTSDVNTYVSAAKGFRSGGFNGFGQPSFGPESVWSYELGTKMRLFDRRLELNADVFDSNYSNYVVVGLLPVGGIPLDVLHNAGSARIKGVEGDITWRPVDDWSFSFNGERLSAKFTEINILGSSYSVGEPVDFVPPYSFNGSVEHTFHVAGKAAYALLNYAEVGRQRYAASVGYLGQSDVIHNLAFHTRADLNDNLSVGFFVQNLLNDRGYLNPLNLETISDRLRPRTYGLEFSAKFGQQPKDSRQ
jgi:iron complex outermembrane receptor protein